VSAGEIDQEKKKMKVNVQVVGLTAVYEALRRNEEIEVEFPGKTMRELIDALVGEFGNECKKGHFERTW
jgi:hypothetical protein